MLSEETPACSASAWRIWTTSSVDRLRVWTRTESPPTVVTCASETSDTPEPSAAERIRPTVPSSTWETGTVKTEPPLNSMPRFRPRTAMARNETTIIAMAMVYQSLRRPTKSMENRLV